MSDIMILMLMPIQKSQYRPRQLARSGLENADLKAESSKFSSRGLRPRTPGPSPGRAGGEGGIILIPLLSFNPPPDG